MKIYQNTPSLKPFSILLIMVFMSLSCSPEKPSEEDSKSFNIEFTEDGVEIPFNSENIQVDFGFSGVGGLNTFDINIQDYYPQTFSIALLSYIPDSVQLEVGKNYPINFWDPLNLDFNFVGFFNHIANWEPFTVENADQELFYSTSPYGYGSLTFSRISEEELEGQFNFTAHVLVALDPVKEVFIKCKFVAKKRVFQTD
jgi:hypothetical protein